MKKFDLIVIGSGSGLDVANAAATEKGFKVAIIEKDKLGGTCLNRDVYLQNYLFIVQI